MAIRQKKQVKVNQLGIQQVRGVKMTINKLVLSITLIANKILDSFIPNLFQDLFSLMRLRIEFGMTAHFFTSIRYILNLLQFFLNFIRFQFKDKISLIYRKKCLYSILVFLLYSTPSFSTSYVNSCTTGNLPGLPNDASFLQNTAYGFLQKNLLMTDCNQDTNSLKFCFGSDCTHDTDKELPLDNSTTLVAVNDSPMFGGNPLLQNIILTTKVFGGQMCLTIPTENGVAALGCRNTSIYAKPPSIITSPSCSVVADACSGSQNGSQSLFNFSGVAVACLTQTLNNIFYKPLDCTQDSIVLRALKPFSSFANTMQIAVTALLIIYVFFYGLKLALNPKYIELNHVATFIGKLILVMYFSIGFAPTLTESSQADVHNGMTDYALPLLSNIAPEFSAMVFNAASTGGLCAFDPSRYASNNVFYLLWDSIDCRISYYFGMLAVYNIDLSGAPFFTPSYSGNVVENISQVASMIAAAELNIIGNLLLFPVIFGLFLGGNIILVISMIVFLILVLSFVIHFLSVYLVSLITLYAISYLAPIFVPMALFERTKSYFSSWLRILLSAALQPVVIAGFVALLFSIYDNVIYQNCQFGRHDYSGFSTFELLAPNSNPSKCLSSAGAKLLNYYLGNGWAEINAILFKIILLKDSLDLLGDFTYILICSIILYFFSRQAIVLAAVITGGARLDSITINATAIADAARKAAVEAAKIIASKGQSLASKEANAQKNGGDGSEGKDEGEGAKRSSPGASDLISKGASGSSDLISKK